MKPLIAIDGRGLFQKNPTGVANAFKNIYQHLQPLAPELSYLIWHNQFKKLNPDLSNFFHDRENNLTVQARIPNNFLHYGWWKFLSQPTADYLVKKFSKQEPHAWWLPNIAQIRLAPKTKYLLTLHDLSFILNPSWYPYRKQLWHKFLRLKNLLDKATYIVCVSNEVKQSALELYKLPEKKLHIGHLAPVELAPQPTTYNLQPTTYFLHLASNLKRKNTDGVISAYKIYRKLTDAPKDLLLIGNYQLKEKISGIISLPYQTEAQLASLYQNAGALLYPSWYEGFGLPILEAQKNNCPVITSAVGSLSEVAGNSALYAQPWDILGLAKLMFELEKNEAWQELLKNEGQKNLARFSWTKTAQLYNYLFWEMIKSKF